MATVPLQPCEMRPVDRLAILHADDHLVAVDKPAGLLVHRSNLDRHETRFALQLVRDQMGREVFPVHRLDKPTSGVLLFAFDRDTCQAMSRRFECGEVDKRYIAVVRGHPDAEFLIDHPLSRLRDEPGALATSAEAQPATTVGRCRATVELPIRVDRYPTSRYALVDLVPRTGRRHQLRRHLKHVSHPIIGDTTYGKSRHNRLFEEQFGCRRLLLACTALRLRHPVTGAALTIRASPGPEFRHVLEQLGWGAAAEPPDD